MLGIQPLVVGIMNITISLQTDASIFTETNYPPIYLMIQSGKNAQVPFGGQMDSSLRLLLESASPEITFSKFSLTYISGALSN